MLPILLFFKCGSIPAFFCFFLLTISIIQIEKSVDGVLEIRTLGHRIVGANKTTELWRPPVPKLLYHLCDDFTILSLMGGVSTDQLHAMPPNEQ